MVLKEGAALAVVRLGVGLMASVPTCSVFGSMVFGISPTDRITYAGVSVVQVMSVVLASFLPARRASHVSHVQALRE